MIAQTESSTYPEEKERELMVLLPKERELVYTVMQKCSFHTSTEKQETPMEKAPLMVTKSI